MTGVSTAVDICRATFRLSTGAAISSSAVFWLSVSTDASAKLDFFKWILKQVGNKLVPQQRLERGFSKQVALMMGGRSGGFQL